MPRNYSGGAKIPRGAPSQMRGDPPPPNRSFREHIGALGNLPEFLRTVWRTSPGLTAASLLLRLVRALLPVATLFVGKLIIDEVVRLVGLPEKPAGLVDWVESGLVNHLGMLVFAEFVLAILSDILGRVVSLVDSLLSERVSNASSIRLMEHAATLDLEDFEDAEFQDQLERARRQTSGRMTLMSQLLGQAQDIITVISFAAGLLVFAPWLIVLLVVALVPAFLGEAHFNARSYSLDYARTPERRELDYVRQTAASVETAKEVKIFGLSRFLIDRYIRLATEFYAANRALALRRASWGGVFTTIGTVGYYLAYAYIVWRALAGQFSIGDLTFLAGSFRRLRQLIEGLLSGFSSTAGQALYLDDLFSFFDETPEIMSPENPRPFPQPDPRGLRLRRCRLPLSRRRALGGAQSLLHAPRRRGAGTGRRERRRQDHAGEAHHPPLRPGRGPHPARRARSARLRPRRAARQHRRHLPGFRPLQSHRRGKHRRRPHRGARRPRAHRTCGARAVRPTTSSSASPPATTR